MRLNGIYLGDNHCKDNRRWAVVLAGGDGTRLRPVTKLIAGDERPKQFCRLLGDTTLFSQTRARVREIVPEDQTSFVLVRAHEPYFLSEVADVEPERLFIQPANKGTTAAIAFALFRLLHFDRDAIVGFFPSDHNFFDGERFLSAVETAYEDAENRRGRVILVGAKAVRPDIEYGWIEPGRQVTGSLRPVYHVTRFWEKPPLPIAECLLEKGCLWNTFVMVGRVMSFIEMLALTAPEALETLAPVGSDAHFHLKGSRLTELFRTLRGGDFSKQVLAAATERLAVCRMSDAGWTDLGTPPRLIAALQRLPEARRGLHLLPRHCN